MTPETAMRLMREHLDSARSAKTAGALNRYMLGFHTGTITAFATACCTKEAFALEGEILTELNKLGETA